MRILKAFLSSRSGATAVEYGLLVTILAIATITGLQLFGNTLNTLFDSIAVTLAGA